MSEQKTSQQPEQDLSEQRRVRREKLAALQAAGQDPFQITKYVVTHRSAEIKENFEALEGQTASVAGRIMSKRGMGKAVFCDLQDVKGRIQLYVRVDELGEEEIEKGHLIVYTSADSVLQICGNEETFDLQNLYRCCEIAREITLSREEWRVGRVIARPYVGKKKGEFKRTSNRHDYALKPTGPTALNAMKDAGLDVIGVGKINDIFCGEGITETYHSDSSVHGMEQTIDICGRDFHGLCFTNLVDFDALWGHRRNVEGYGREIEKFDRNLGVLLERLQEDDLLILTADHGNDPAYTGTDHTREYVPFLAYSKKMAEGGPLPEADSFAVKIGRAHV